MQERGFELLVLSPEKPLYNGVVTSLLLPGEKSPFMVLYNHAPIISSLSGGTMEWGTSEKVHSLDIAGGFVQVSMNKATVCVELAE